MRCQSVIALLALLILAAAAHAERLAYATAPGRVDYRYEVSIAGTMKPPGGVPLPVALQMRARIIDQVTGKPQKGLSPVTMSIKDVELNGSSGGDEFGDDVDNTVVRFLRSPAGVVSKLQYVQAPAKEDTLIPGLENAWLLFSRFGHHLRLPEQELRAGEKWKAAETLEMSTGRTMTLTVESTLVGEKVVDGTRYVQIDSTFKLAAPKTRPAGDEQAADPLAEFTMSGKSYLLFNPRAGEVFRSTLKATITAKTAMGVNASGADAAATGKFAVTVIAHRTAPPAAGAPANDEK